MPRARSKLKHTSSCSGMSMSVSIGATLSSAAVAVRRRRRSPCTGQGRIYSSVDVDGASTQSDTGNDLFLQEAAGEIQTHSAQNVSPSRKAPVAPRQLQVLSLSRKVSLACQQNSVLSALAQHLIISHRPRSIAGRKKVEAQVLEIRVISGRRQGGRLCRLFLY